MHARRSQRRGQHGFTLIEMIIVLAIVILLFAGVVQGMGAITGSAAKQSTVELSGVIRNLYDSAALSGKTCRLVFDLPGERTENGTVSWRAECAKGAVTATAKRDDELKEARTARRADEAKNDRRFQRLGSSTDQPSLQELQEREKNRVDEAAKFSSFKNDDVVEKHLDSSVKVEVWTAKQKTKVTSGPAYLYFFPQGFTERSQIWFRQGSNVWTVTVAPLTGQTIIHSEDLEVPR